MCRRATTRRFRRSSTRMSGRRSRRRIVIVSSCSRSRVRSVRNSRVIHA